ncbi:MAG: hypothetical protein H5T72_06195 [Actinobacteria bacterium]|nr:hypothetical protein [Actinomycetota bacterium]
MRGWCSVAKGSLAVCLVALLLLFLLAFPGMTAAAGGVTVEVSIAPCVRVRADGTLQSNIPAVTQRDAGHLLTVTAK